MSEVLDALERAWNRSDELFSMLSTEDLCARGIPLRHPFIFYVGHLPAFAWNHLAAVTGAGPFDESLDGLFARGIDPEDEAAAVDHVRSSWPGISEVEAYRDGIRRRVPEVAALLPDIEQADPLARWVLPMVLEHELMHHETLLYMLHRIPPERLVRPKGWEPPPEGPRVAAHEEISIGGGQVRLGAVREELPFGWDNEFPVASELVDPFRIDRLPVTVGDFLGFVEGGGYADDALWTEQDRRWRDEVGLEHPDAWRRTTHGWKVRSLFEWHDMDRVSGWPVYVSLAEARAFCRFRGDRRLPTEAELHHAAFGAPGGERREWAWGSGSPEAAHGAFDFHVKGPVPVGRRPAGRSAWGVEELVGNGWEWTSTPFLPRVGFEAHLRTYAGYSADFFDGKHYVVFGGSWATDARLLRPSFRNWYQHHYPYVFATFRTVRA